MTKWHVSAGVFCSSPGYTQTRKHYSAFKRKEVLTLATGGEPRGHVMLSEMGQSQREKQALSLLLEEVPGAVNFTDNEGRR